MAEAFKFKRDADRIRHEFSSITEYYEERYKNNPFMKNAVISAVANIREHICEQIEAMQTDREQ